jgi:Na+(H+)/acetate symporter ActP
MFCGGHLLCITLTESLQEIVASAHSVLASCQLPKMVVDAMLQKIDLLTASEAGRDWFDGV